MGLLGLFGVGRLYACDGDGRDQFWAGTNRCGDYPATPYGYQRRTLDRALQFDAYGDDADFPAQCRDERDSDFVPLPSRGMRTRERRPDFSRYEQQIPQEAGPSFGPSATSRSTRFQDSAAPVSPEPGFNPNRAARPISPEASVRYGGQKTCPVTGEELGSMGPALPVTIKGRTVFVCCKACVSAVKRNPAKFLQAVDAELDASAEAQAQ